MVFKFVTLFALVAAANAGFIPVGPGAYAAAPVAYAAAPIAKAVLTKTVDADYDPHPQYNYAYDVQDSLTGDFKSQQESRDGDVVHGSYSLVEADGSRRIVDYTADPANGFNAVVRKEPAQVAVKAVAAAPITAYAAPAIAKIHPAPAPIAKIAYAAPVAYAARPLAPAAYAAPTAYAAPAAYAAPVAYAASAPYAKIAGPISYISHVSYSTPLFSYSH